jgi:branched-chain amino acid transport system substrate-binding protein
LILIGRESLKTKEPIKVGLPATLTNTSSSYGRHVRNGAILAAEHLNTAGGINGRSVELIVKDDKGSPEEALRVDRELMDENVVAILGHYLSTLAVKTVPLMNEKNILMVGATASTAELAGIDDNFIRIIPPGNKQALLLAKVAYEQLNLRKMAVVYDISNLKYTESFYRYFKKGFERDGGHVSVRIPFDSRKQFSMPDIAKKIMSSDVEGLFIITNAFHGALICQHVRKSGSRIKIVASGWSFPDPDFIMHGGAAVEGVVSVSIFDKESISKTFIDFKKRYESRFGEKIGEGSLLGYEAAQVLFSALSKTNDPGKLKETILNQREFKGIDNKIIIDEYGDALRAMYISEIKNGAIHIAGKIEP